jgi:hypothetical protein
MGLGVANRVEVSRVDVHPRGRSLNGKMEATRARAREAGS